MILSVVTIYHPKNREIPKHSRNLDDINRIAVPIICGPSKMPRKNTPKEDRQDNKARTLQNMPVESLFSIHECELHDIQIGQLNSVVPTKAGTAAIRSRTRPPESQNRIPDTSTERNAPYMSRPKSILKRKGSVSYSNSSPSDEDNEDTSAYSAVHTATSRPPQSASVSRRSTSSLIHSNTSQIQSSPRLGAGALKTHLAPEGSPRPRPILRPVNSANQPSIHHEDESCGAYALELEHAMAAAASSHRPHETPPRCEPAAPSPLPLKPIIARGGASRAERQLRRPCGRVRFLLPQSAAGKHGGSARCGADYQCAAADHVGGGGGGGGGDPHPPAHPPTPRGPHTHTPTPPTHVRVHVCVAHADVQGYTHMHTHAHMHMHMHTPGCNNTRTRTHPLAARTPARTRARAHTHNTHTCTRACTHTRRHARLLFARTAQGGVRGPWTEVLIGLGLAEIKHCSADLMPPGYNS